MPTDFMTRLPAVISLHNCEQLKDNRPLRDKVWMVTIISTNSNILIKIFFEGYDVRSSYRLFRKQEISENLKLEGRLLLELFLVLPVVEHDAAKGVGYLHLNLL